MIKKKYVKGKYYYDNYKSINKEMLIFLVKKRTKIEKDHVKAVINFFLNQLEEDLFKSKTISINNFIEFNLRRMPAKRGRNYYTGEIVPTKPFNTMKVSINSRLNKKLMKYFDAKAYYELEDHNIKKDPPKEE